MCFLTKDQIDVLFAHEGVGESQQPTLVSEGMSPRIFSVLKFLGTLESVSVTF